METIRAARGKLIASRAYNHCADGFEYAYQVIEGEIPACNYVKIACQRFLDDLEREDLYFDYDAAERFCVYFEQLPHVKGQWARRKERIKLQAWQKFKFINIFGLKRKANNKRKYQEVYSEVPRKNGKSIDAGGVGLYMTALDGEHGAEVYCGATSEKQANEVFKPATLMLKRDPELCEFLGLEVMAKSIFRVSDNSLFQPVIGDPPDGPSPNCGIVDEYHEHKKDNVYKTFQTGMGARSEPLLYVITTAGDNIGGPCHEKRQEAVQILEGILTDNHADSTFVLIYTIDIEDSNDEFWKTEEALIMANPNYGVSIDAEWLRTQQAQAARSTKDQGFFKTKHLNIWVNQTDPFINFEDWRACGDSSLNIDDYSLLPCKMGVDLSSRIDFTATCKVFYEDDLEGKRHYYLFPLFWLPEERRPEYPAWGDRIIFTEGDEIDTKAVKRRMLEDIQAYNVEEVVFDPWKSAGFEQELEDHGAEIVKFPQTIGHYTMPMNEFEAAIKSGRLHHCNDPVFNWMLSNLHGKRDTNGNVKPRKEDVKKKIDGIVAAIMGVGRSMSFEDEGFSPTILTL